MQVLIFSYENTRECFGRGGAVMSAKPIKKVAVKTKIKPKLKTARAKVKTKGKVNLKATVNAKANAKVIKKPVAKKVIRKPEVKPPKKSAVPKVKTIKSLPKPVVKKAEAKTPAVKDIVMKPKPKSETQITNKIVMEPMTETLMTKPVQQAKPKAPKESKKPHLSTMGVPPYQESKGEEYMNINQREHFGKILRLWKKELMEEVDRTVHHMQDDAANFPDPNDRATQEEEFSLELRARDRERKLIKKIDEALQQIENNEYGYCDVCGIEIGIRRLEARPTATLCIDCKTLDEIRERTHG
jgi:DnaK suppressor protein